jgi:hypothetical protein
MNDPQTEPYEQLADLIERELQLVAERRFDELERLEQLRSTLQNSLPAVPPVAARPALQRGLLLHKRLQIELLRVREAVLHELGHLRRAQRTAVGYAPPRANGRRVTTSA